MRYVSGYGFAMSKTSFTTAVWREPRKRIGGALNGAGRCAGACLAAGSRCIMQNLARDEFDLNVCLWRCPNGSRAFPLQSRRVLTIHADLITARGRNTYSYTTAPRIPPRRGPSQYTHQLSKKPDATAGPSHRPGLIAAPVKYPPKSQSTPTVSPIWIAPSVFAAPRESIAVAKTTNTTRNVINNSRSIAPSRVIAFTAGVARWRGAETCAGQSQRRTSPPKRLPRSWKAMITAPVSAL